MSNIRSVVLCTDRMEKISIKIKGIMIIITIQVLLTINDDLWLVHYSMTHRGWFVNPICQVIYEIWGSNYLMGISLYIALFI